MAGVIYKGVRATDGRKVQLTASDNPENTAGASILANELGAANGIATLDGSSLVVQNPASADSAANPNTIALRDGNGDVIVPLSPTAVGGAASKLYVDNLVTQGRSWKELLLVPEQLAAGASGGIKQATLVALTVELTASDTFIITDGTTTETWTAVAGAPAAFQFQLGGTAAATTTNLVAAITADSTLWEAVETGGLDTYFSGSNDPQFVVQRQVPSEGNADRVYGVISNGQTDVQVVRFGASTFDYAAPASTQADLASTDPGFQYAGFGRITANLIPGETHIAVENNSANTWDEDDQVWQQTVAGQTLDGNGLQLVSNVLSVQPNTTDGGGVPGLETATNGVRIATTAAGNGLTGGGGAALAVEADVTTGGNVQAANVVANGVGLDVSAIAGTNLEADGAANLRIAAAAAGDGLTGGGASALAVEPNVTDGGGQPGLETAANGVRISAGAAGNGLTGGGGAALSVEADVTTGGNIQAANVVANGVGLDVSAIAGTGLEADGSANLRIAAAAAGDGLTGGAGSALATDVDVPRWRQYTVAESAFTAAAGSEDIELFSLPAGGIIQGVKIKHSTAFSGGTLSAFTVSVGITGTLDKYASAFDVFQAVADTTFQVSNSFGSENHGAATSIRINATATGDTVNNATAGSVDVWVLWSVAV